MGGPRTRCSPTADMSHCGISERWRSPTSAASCMRPPRRRVEEGGRGIGAAATMRRRRRGAPAWRPPRAKAIYKERAATSECVNALARNRGLHQFVVRGLGKVKAVLLWFALAHNLLRAVTLRHALAGAV